MYPGPAPLVVWLGIPSIAAALALLFVLANRAACLRLGLTSAAVRQRTFVAAALSGGWCVLWGALAASGVLARFDAHPPPLALFLASVVVARAERHSPAGLLQRSYALPLKTFRSAVSRRAR